MKLLQPHYRRLTIDGLHDEISLCPYRDYGGRPERDGYFYTVTHSHDVGTGQVFSTVRATLKHAIAAIRESRRR